MRGDYVGAGRDLEGQSMAIGGNHRRLQQLRRHRHTDGSAHPPSATTTVTAEHHVVASTCAFDGLWLRGSVATGRSDCRSRPRRLPLRHVLGASSIDRIGGVRSDDDGFAPRFEPVLDSVSDPAVDVELLRRGVVQRIRTDHRSQSEVARWREVPHWGPRRIREVPSRLRRIRVVLPRNASRRSGIPAGQSSTGPSSNDSVEWSYVAGPLHGRHGYGA